jgi:hypothetical protein
VVAADDIGFLDALSAMVSAYDNAINAVAKRINFRIENAFDARVNVQR